MVVPVPIFVACFGGGVVAASRRLPELADGPVGGLAFFAVCGLLGATLGLVGLHIYAIVGELGSSPFGGSKDDAEVLASGLAALLFEVGSIFGLAAIVYLLAPRGSQS